MTIERVNVSKGQVPTEADWEDWLNRAIDKLNAGIAPADLVKVGGKVEISITGDADTVDGMHAATIIAGDYPDIKKTLIDFISGGNDLVLTGGVATKNPTIANQLDITACTVIQKVTATGYIDRVDLPAASKTTTLANQTYYLDVMPGAADYSWSTSHPAGDYVPLATVTTDSSANIATVLDTRPLLGKILAGFDAKINAEDFCPGVLDQASAPAGNTTATTGLKAALSWIVNRLKTVSGETNWWDAVGTSLKSLVSSFNTHQTAVTLDHPDGSVTAAKLASGAAVSNIGYTPVNKAGDTMTGNLILNNNLQILGKDTGAASRRLVQIGSDNAARYGDSALMLRFHSSDDPVLNDSHTLWHAGNDGAGSGLDADLLDGQHGSYYDQNPKFDATTGHKHTGAAGGGPIIEFAAGDVLLAQHTADWATSSTTYVKAKGIKAGRGGTFRIKFDLLAQGGVAYGKIYKNDVPVGTEWSTSSSTPVTFTEDIPGWSPNDRIQIYIHGTGSVVHVSNFILSVSAADITSIEV